MRNRTIHKLNFRRGASLVIALVIFLLCALAGASAFFMAASNEGRFAHSDEQQYYSVSSAALLLVDLLHNLTYTSQKATFTHERTWSYTEAGNERTENETYSLTLPDPTEQGTMAHGSDLKDLDFYKKIRERCDTLVPLYIPNEWYEMDSDESPAAPTIGTGTGDIASSVTSEFTIDVKDDDTFGTVNCTMVMNTSYHLIFTLNGGDNRYSITVYWEAEVETKKETGETKFDYTTPDGNKYVGGTHTVTDTMQVIAKWKKENVTISRGQATEGE